MELHFILINIFLLCLYLFSSAYGSPIPDPQLENTHPTKTWIDKRQLVKDLLGIIDNPLGSTPLPTPAPPIVPIPPVARPSLSLPPVVVLPTPAVTQPQPVATPNLSEAVNAVAKALCDRFLMSVIAACSSTSVSAGCGVLSAVLTAQCAGVVAMPVGLVDVNKVVATVPSK